MYNVCTINLDNQMLSSKKSTSAHSSYNKNVFMERVHNENNSSTFSEQKVHFYFQTASLASLVPRFSSNIAEYYLQTTTTTIIIIITGQIN
jgi:hypothetical protein